MAEGCIKIITEVGKCIWPLVKPRIDYWWGFDGNVQRLRDETRGLEMERSNANHKLKVASDLNAESATTDFNNWSNEVTQKLEEANRILQRCDDLKAWNIKQRYSEGKAAHEIAEGIAKLRNEGNLITISDPAPSAAMAHIPHAPASEFQSRKRIEEDIMESLKDGHVRMIAICGPGGVGKTTMAKQFEDRVRKERLFDEVVSVVVGQQTDQLKIQKQIAEILRLDLSEETLAGRAHKLCTRLMDSKKLIIFDDVWENLELEDIGVPYGGCKVILTSRLKDVCGEMEADRIIEIEVLNKKEAWTLFREKSGDCVDDLALRPIAEDVAAECRGLPIALVTVGKALKDKSINTWEDALSQLRRANPTNFPKVLNNVYMPLKLSYDYLETDERKNLFLLCCLFPDDYDIEIEELALLSFGLRLFEGINTIEDGRNRTYHLLETLKSRFLLMNDQYEDFVKMHDVVRDVAIFIGSKEKLPIGFLKSLEVMDLNSKDSSRDCNWMSVDISVANAKLPVRLDFPNLRLLMILKSTHSEFSEGFDVNDIRFEGMEELTVLYFSKQNISSSLKFLKKLRKLHLYKCYVNDISVVGELTSLEILRVLRCDDIEELPGDVRELKFLRLLELKRCKKLERIVAGVISSLVGLEELKIVDCFNKWEGKGNPSEERNASLSELESLHNLTSLEIEIFDPNLVSLEMLLSKKLIRYQIRFYDEHQNLVDFFNSDNARKITLYLSSNVKVGNWIRRLVNSIQSLALNGDGSNNINLGEIERLRKLSLVNCSTLEKLVNAVDCKFLTLEHLQLKNLEKLEKIIPDGSNSFQNLEYIYISNCPNLRCLFTMAKVRSFVQFRSLYIDSCETMEQVLWNDMEISNIEEASIIIEFPKLETLTLENLPNLVAFIQGVETIKFPQLTDIEIVDCPKLNSFVPIDSEPNHDDQSLHLFCNKKVEIIGLEVFHLLELSDKINKIWCRHIPISFFRNLKRLYIQKVDGIKNSISSSIAKALVHLKTLYISFCKEMIHVIEDEIHVTDDTIFPNLQYLNISSNFKLRSFCQWKRAFDLPSLQTVEIYDCPMMKTFTLGSLSTPNVKRFAINNKDFESKDLNGGIHLFTSTENANKDENNEDEYSEDEYNEDENNDDEYDEDEKHDYSDDDHK